MEFFLFFVKQDVYVGSNKNKDDDHSGSASIPDCVLHDCMVRDERDDMPMAGCQFEGMKLTGTFKN